MKATRSLPNRNATSLLAQIPCCILAAILLYACPAQASLLVRYTFEEASGPALDTGSAPASDGTFSGSAVRTGNTPNGTGSALNVNFAGTTTYLSCGNPDKLNNLTNFTLTAWMNLQANPVANDRLLDKLAAAGGFGWKIGNASATSAQLALHVNSTSGQATSSANVNATNQWVFLAVSYRGTAASANVLFYSGASNAPVTQLGTAQTYAKGIVTNTVNELRVGSTPASASDRTPPAWFDDVRVYNTVLSVAELEQVRQEETPNQTLPAQVTLQPANQAAYVGTSATFSPAVAGTDPVLRQWYFNGTNRLDGATNTTLTLTNVSLELAGLYSLFVSNAYGHTFSSNATLAVFPYLNSGQMTNIWNLVPGDRTYIGTGSTERGLAYDPLSKQLLLASRSPSESLVALDPQTGAEEYFLNVTGVGATISGSYLGLNLVGVAADGKVYAASKTVNASTYQYIIYQWPDASSNNAPVMVFIGDPGASAVPSLNWGDNLTVRGAGPNTQILISPTTGTNVVLLRTLTGSDFLTEVPPAVIAVSGVPSGFASLGLALGPGTNTFWAKTAGQQLYLVQFDIAAGTGTVLHSYATVGTSLRGIAADSQQRWLAGVSVGVATGLADNATLFDISDLVGGPAVLDQELFTPRNANAGGNAATAFGDNYLFALDCNNGIKAFLIDTNYVPPLTQPQILVQPQSATVMAGASVGFSVAAVGGGLSYQWRLNGFPIAGATDKTYSISSALPDFPAGYQVVVSNTVGSVTSTVATLTVIPFFNTAVMTNLWALPAGSRSYLATSASTERGLAFDPTTTNLVLVSRAGGTITIVALNPLTGEERFFLNTAGISGGTLAVNNAAIASDGALYIGNLTTNANATAYQLYRWASVSTDTYPTVAFSGDPGGASFPGLRWGDNLAVRGAGAGTQVLLSPGGGPSVGNFGIGTNIVTLLRTADGVEFQSAVPPVVMPITNALPGFANLGLAFGPGTNTCLTKNINFPLSLVEFDIATGFGHVAHAYGYGSVPASVTVIAADLGRNFLGGLAFDTPNNVRLYNISDLTRDPVLIDQELFVANANGTTLGGTGAAVFGQRYLFVLDSNAGLMSFELAEPYTLPAPFQVSVTAQAGPSFVLNWPSESGRFYQVWAKAGLTDVNWTAIGQPVIGTGASVNFTNALPSGATRYYRVQGQ